MSVIFLVGLFSLALSYWAHTDADWQFKPFRMLASILLLLFAILCFATAAHNQTPRLSVVQSQN